MRSLNPLPVHTRSREQAHRQLVTLLDRMGYSSGDCYGIAGDMLREAEADQSGMALHDQVRVIVTDSTYTVGWIAR